MGYVAPGPLVGHLRFCHPVRGVGGPQAARVMYLCPYIGVRPFRSVGVKRPVVHGVEPPHVREPKSQEGPSKEKVGTKGQKRC